jgi:hypothetical protein
MTIESIIDTYATAEKADTFAYNDLVTAATQLSFGDKIVWELECRKGEDIYMEKEFHNIPEAKKKNGTWKYRTYLNGSYTSAKSIIGTALELGIPITDTSGEHAIPKGKTALQNEIKAAKGADSENEKSNRDKIKIMLSSVKALYSKEEDFGERSRIRSIVDEFRTEVGK